MGGGNDSFTKIMLHMDGSNGGTTFTDNNFGGSAHTFTAHGTTSTSTAQQKFGTASFSVGGSVSGLDYIDTPDSADFTVGSGDFTADAWVWIAGGAGTQRFLCGQSNSAGSLISYYIGLANTNVFFANAFASDGSTALIGLTGVNTYTATGWHHVALVRSGNNFNLYIDGTSEASGTASGAIYDSADNYAVGRIGALAVDSWNGFVDEFRLSVGIARWTSNFTPPTVAYTLGYSLAPAAGAFALTGNVANQKQSRVASKGTFALTGVSQTLTKAWKPLAAAVGAFTISGQVANQHQSRVANVGAYVLTGRATTRAIGFLVSGGAFVLSGISAAQKISRLSSKGTFTLTGQVASQKILHQSNAGAFSLVGQIANQKISHLSGTGTFVLSGVAIFIIKVAAATGFDRLRQLAATLYQTRTTAPELED